MKARDGRRPGFGAEQSFQQDLHWSDGRQFHECFRRDDGAGLGATHQAGRTRFITRSLNLFATTSAGQVIELGKGAVAVEIEKPASRSDSAPFGSRKRQNERNP